MKNTPMDEPVEATRDDLLNDQIENEDEPVIPPREVPQPGIVAGAGSSALGSADLDAEKAEDVEPQRRRHPDNDGETVEG